VVDTPISFSGTALTVSINPAFIPISHILTEPRPGDSIICVWKGGILVWSDFTRLISGLTGALSSESTESAIVACADPLNFLATLLALWHCGRTPVVPSNYRPETLKQLTGRGCREINDADVASLADRHAPARLGRLDPSACRLILYTSGSSGDPKMISKTLTQLDAELSTLDNLWGDAITGCGVLATVPHHHIYGLLFRLLWPLAAGRPFDRCTCANPQQLGERISCFSDHVLVSSPSHLTRFPLLMEFCDWKPQPRMLFSSGGPLPAETAGIYRQELGNAPVEIFGSTETGGVAWRHLQGSPDEDAWTPLPGVCVNRDTDNALLLDSPFLSHRNWRMDDAISLLGDGRFRLEGRLDRIIKLEGKRLALPEMERRLEGHAWVASAAVVPLPAVNRLGAVVVPTLAGQSALKTYGQHETKQALRDHLKDAFESVLLPRRFRFVTELPISDRGKITHHELKSLFESDDESDA
jgi:acyl-coenzyme A synthetase/AMP-(fatty) acid ligase